ncbi:MAG TPA: SGNH/GDSL hydrolase family protein, partial [Terriglobales bacterium]|nr:SGNH/GDSL hydrolase family protein [Terriglobales bacterium]
MRYLNKLGEGLRATSLIIGNTVALLVVCFALGEVWARSVAPMPAEEKTITVLNQHAAYHPWAGYRNTPGFSYENGNLPRIVINSWGWRGPEPSIARTKGVKRAVLLGDSVVFSGWGGREDATLGGALKRALEIRTNEEWEVINTAVGGSFSSVVLGTLAHDAIQFQPDVVVSLNGISDSLIMDKSTTFIQLGTGLFKHSLYQQAQIDMAKAFDPRTGTVQQSGLFDQLAKKSALIRMLSSSPLFAKLKQMEAAPILPTTPAVAPYSTVIPDRLDTYINNQLAMSYLAVGSGAKFVGFLQPYFSLER